MMKGKKPPIHVVDVNDDFPSILSTVATCSRCYLQKEIGETVIYVFPKHTSDRFHYVEAFDICKDCLPFVKAVDGHPDVERRRKEAEANPFSTKKRDDQGRLPLAPYMHCSRARWRNLDEIRREMPGPDYNIEGEPPIPGVSLWRIGHDDNNNPIWKKRPCASAGN